MSLLSRSQERPVGTDGVSSPDFHQIAPKEGSLIRLKRWLRLTCFTTPPLSLLASQPPSPSLPPCLPAPTPLPPPLRPQECDALRRMAEPHLQTSTVVNAQTGQVGGGLVLTSLTVGGGIVCGES